MRIGVDARELCGRATGVGRYLAGLLREWSSDARARRHEFVLYAPEPLAMPLDARRFPARIVPGSAGTWWEQVRVPRAAPGDHLDVWFAPAYTAPLRLTLPIVVAIHDVSFAAHPEWFGLREGMRRRWLCRRTAAAACAVITISEFSRGELVERLDVPDVKISVIPPGVSAPPGQRLVDIRGHGRLLFAGSILNRRHVADLIRAFAPIAREHPDVALDIVGDNRTHPREDLRRTIATEGLQQQVRWHEYVDDDRLRQLYAHATAFAFLSEYEGLGLTPLEALAAGLPPVLLDTPVARESCADAAIYVPPGDLPATTRAIERALFDETTRSRIREAAPAALAKYNWRRAACRTLTVIEGCCR
jgi:glycosyltransferase involved in cell wall biosynthesis